MTRVVHRVVDVRVRERLTILLDDLWVNTMVDQLSSDYLTLRHDILLYYEIGYRLCITTKRVILPSSDLCFLTIIVEGNKVYSWVGVSKTWTKNTENRETTESSELLLFFCRRWISELSVLVLPKFGEFYFQTQWRSPFHRTNRLHDRLPFFPCTRPSSSFSFYSWYPNPGLRLYTRQDRWG